MSGIKEIRRELKELDKEELQELILKVSKYNKEVKGYLVHLLFESDDITYFQNEQKQKLEEFFSALPFTNFKIAKKSLSRIQKYLNLQLKYAKSKEVEIELRGTFLLLFRKKVMGKSFSHKLTNMYDRNYKYVIAAHDKLEDDLKNDYNDLLTILAS